MFDASDLTSGSIFPDPLAHKGKQPSQSLNLYEADFLTFCIDNISNRSTDFCYLTFCGHQSEYDSKSRNGHGAFGPTAPGKMIFVAFNAPIQYAHLLESQTFGQAIP